MEKILHDVLNASIALFRAGEDTINNSVKEVLKTFDELKDKGASDTSEPAVKLRKLLDDVVSQVNDLSGKAGSSYDEALAQLKTQYAAISEQVEKLVPEERVTEIKTKFDELTNLINEKIGANKTESGTGV